MAHSDQYQNHHSIWVDESAIKRKEIEKKDFGTAGGLSKKALEGEKGETAAEELIRKRREKEGNK